jgi:hypothetical protein
MTGLEKLALNQNSSPVNKSKHHDSYQMNKKKRKEGYRLTAPFITYGS